MQRAPGPSQARQSFIDAKKPSVLRRNPPPPSSCVVSVQLNVCHAPPTRAEKRGRGGGGGLNFPSKQEHACQITPSFAKQQSAGCARRIALLFLARDRIFHEDTWADWIRGAQGLVPRSAVRVCWQCSRYRHVDRVLTASLFLTEKFCGLTDTFKLA